MLGPPSHLHRYVRSRSVGAPESPVRDSRKYYLRSEDGLRVGGIYLWETRAAAEAVYSVEWKARVTQLYGAEPEISWFDTPVIVDNQAGGTISKAA
jgi:hypothetical protein